MPPDSRELFLLFFRELEKRSIPYVILHSYENLPEEINPESDIDFAVPNWALAQLPVIQIAVARQHDWLLVQTMHHDLGCYSVFAQPDNPAHYLKLDACSSYARVRRLLVREEVLLANRLKFRDFYIPQPAAEFIYEAAKLFDNKDKPPEKYLPRLKQLWTKDPANAQRYFNELFGNTGRSLEEWFAAPPEEWRPLRSAMLSRNRFGPGLLLRELLRVVRRVGRPTGVCIVLLGSDGAGKSLLLSRLQARLEPYFRYQKIFHFRPAIFRKRTIEPTTEPHGRPPRGLAWSWFKVLYYFLDWWAGWLFLVIPAKICSTAVIFDRGFDDLIVDEKRYRLQRTVGLAQILRLLLPRVDRTYVLTAPPAVLHRRKQEIAIEELQRQQTILRNLANRENYVLVSAELAADDVTRTVWRDLICHLAAREEKRQ